MGKNVMRACVRACVCVCVCVCVTARGALDIVYALVGDADDGFALYRLGYFSYAYYLYLQRTVSHTWKTENIN